MRRLKIFYNQKILSAIGRTIHYWALGVVRFRWWVIGLSVLLVGAMMYPIFNLEFDNSNEMWFLENDPNLKHYEETNYQFGDHQSFAIGVEARPQDIDLFCKETLILIKELSDFLEQQDFVSKVTSLSNYQYMRYENGQIIARELIEDLEQWQETKQTVDELVKIMSEEEQIHGTLITKDLRHTLIVAKIVYTNESFDHHLKLFKKLQAFIEKKGYRQRGYTLHLTGTSALYGEIQEINELDRSIIQPLMIVLLLILLFATFRTKLGVLCPMMVVLSSLAVTYGFIGLMGWRQNILNTPSLFGLLIASGVGDSIHIISEFYQFRHQGYSAQKASVESMKELFVPCFYTSLTTSVGFLAITVTRLAPLREYGFIASVGVFAAFVFSVSTLPAILSLTSSVIKNPNQYSNQKAFAHWITEFTFKYNRLIMFTCACIFVVVVMLSLQVTTDSSYKHYFKPSSSIRKDLEYFDQHYKNTGGLIIVIDTKGAKEAEFLNLLKRLAQLQDFLESLELTGKVQSVVNYVRYINKIMHHNDSAYYTISESASTLDRYVQLYQDSNPRQNLRDLVSLEGRYIKLEVPQRYVSSLVMSQQIEIIRHELKKAFPGFKTVITGEAVLDSSKDRYVISGLGQSFSIALVIILLCFFLLLHSFKYGMIALLPSLFPIAFAGGVMSIFGIFLNFSTMVIASLTFGIAVDDTMHMMTRYSRGRREGYSRKESIYFALSDAGRAIIFTSVILFFGFSINLLAHFMPLVHFALLGGVIIVVASIADLFLLPAMLFIIGDDGNETSKI
ncbi:efflux RND transporter permease subunit [Deltaproteobacteria bacterium TL4]